MRTEGDAVHILFFLECNLDTGSLGKLFFFQPCDSYVRCTVFLTGAACIRSSACCWMSSLRARSSTNVRAAIDFAILSVRRSKRLVVTHLYKVSMSSLTHTDTKV